MTSVAVLLASGAAYLLYRHYGNNINRVHGLFTTRGDGPAAGDPQNFLIVGSDTRADSTAADLQAEHTTNEGSPALSDTMILAHISPKTSKATLVSFPRDSWVTIASYTDPKTGKTTPPHKAKLNSAFSEGELPGGNAPLLIQTISDLTKVRIDHYVQVDFKGFRNMVNALGGIDICLTQPVKDLEFSGVNLSAGHHTLNGETALSFVRQRHGLTNGDLDRIGHQQQFIGSIVRKVTSADTLTNPLKLNAFLNVATKSVSVDQGLSTSELTSLAVKFRHLDPQHVVFTTAPVTDIGATRGGQSVVLLDDAALAALSANIRDDQPLGAPAPAGAAPAPAGPPLIVAPNNIRLRVQNGTSIDGLGGRGSADLEKAGFVVIGSPTSAEVQGGATVVRFGPTKADSARTVAAAIPGSTLMPDSSLGSTLVVVLGSGYTGAHAVSVGAPSPSNGPSGGASPAPSAGAQPPPVTAAQDPCSGG
ncbi:MAG: LCP family protein [Actinomycetota bacterium]|nr:LCP family protein [Actinomycetota bacterium]